MPLHRIGRFRSHSIVLLRFSFIRNSITHEDKIWMSVSSSVLIEDTEGPFEVVRVSFRTESPFLKRINFFVPFCKNHFWDSFLKDFPFSSVNFFHKGLEIEQFHFMVCSKSYLVTHLLMESQREDHGCFQILDHIHRLNLLPINFS